MPSLIITLALTLTLTNFKLGQAVSIPSHSPQLYNRNSDSNMFSNYRTSRQYSTCPEKVDVVLTSTSLSHVEKRVWDEDRQSRQWPDQELPYNLGVLFVPQQQAWIVERMGKFNSILSPGLNFAWPFLDRVQYVIVLKEFAVDIPTQHAVTQDNVVLTLDAVLFLQVIDPLLTSYGIHDPEFAVTQLAQTTMRSELGKMPLDGVFHERDSLNTKIVNVMNQASAAWGICCLRYEIRDMQLPPKILEAMEMQVEAERKKRAQILTSEAMREADINISEGQKISRILASEAEKQEKINYAMGESAAIIAKAEAQAKGIEKIGISLGNDNGQAAAALLVTQEYVKAFQNLAKSSTTVLLPHDPSDISSLVAKALTVFKGISKV